MTITNVLRTMNKYIFLILCLGLVACGPRVAYSSFTECTDAQWNADSIVTFSFSVPDTVNEYDILLHVRHTDNYPYQNMWLFVQEGYADQQPLGDTIEFYLADERGRWLGDGRTRITMPVLYREGIRFPHAGEYRIAVQQGMRTESLRGVTEVGIEVINR